MGLPAAGGAAPREQKSRGVGDYLFRADDHVHEADARFDRDGLRRAIEVRVSMPAIRSHPLRLEHMFDQRVPMRRPLSWPTTGSVAGGVRCGPVPQRLSENRLDPLLQGAR